MLCFGRVCAFHSAVLDTILNMNTALFIRVSVVFAGWGLADIGLLLATQQLALRLVKNSKIALKEDLFSAVLRMPYQAYRAQSKEPLSILTNDTESIANNYFSSLLRSIESSGALHFRF